MIRISPGEDAHEGVRLLAARWLFPISRPPIADGALALRDGRIIGVGPRADVAASWPAATRLDMGHAALLPGLVNCHTHLELGALDPPPPDGNFARWLVTVIERRRETPASVRGKAAETSARRLLECGTTCLGEVSTTGESLAPLLRLGLRGVVYRELLGLRPEDAEARCAAAQAELHAMQRASRGSRLRIGLSPHSPYSLSEELLRLCGTALLNAGLPGCIHVAESAEEVEFLATGTGGIPSILFPAVGCAVAPPRRRGESPIASLGRLGLLAARPLLIHAVHVDEADCRRMAESGVAVAHCPRSNAHLSGAVAPVADFLRRGIPVGLGTDSLASVSTLDLWDEMRAALAAHAGRLTAASVLEMATLGGARALGLGDQVGSLDVGKRADVIAVAADAVSASDPVGSLIAGTQGDDVLLGLVEGERCHRRPVGAPCA